MARRKDFTVRRQGFTAQRMVFQFGRVKPSLKTAVLSGNTAPLRRDVTAPVNFKLYIRYNEHSINFLPRIESMARYPIWFFPGTPKTIK